MVTYKHILTFGKHKGKTVKEVLFEDPSWLLWADDKVEGFELSDYLRDEAEDLAAEEDCWYPSWGDINDDWGDRD